MNPLQRQMERKRGEQRTIPFIIEQRKLSFARSALNKSVCWMCGDNFSSSTALKLIGLALRSVNSPREEDTLDAIDGPMTLAI